MISFVSHELFPEDQYTKEVVYLCLEGKYRVAFARKKATNGGEYWSTVTLGVTKNGKKLHLQGFLTDSRFLEQDIRRFLDERSWEKGKSAPVLSEKSVFDDEAPF